MASNGDTGPVSWEHVQSALAEVARIIGESEDRRMRADAMVLTKLEGVESEVKELTAAVFTLSRRVDEMATKVHRTNNLAQGVLDHGAEFHQTTSRLVRAVERLEMVTDGLLSDKRESDRISAPG